jgi:hypothetical protein
MIIQKMSLLQRGRMVFTALVILAGLGSTLIAMKPAQKMAAYTYGVAETSGGTHYQVLRNVTNEPRENYDCLWGAPVCTVTTNQSVPTNGLILKTDDKVDIVETGTFVYNE